MPSAASKLEKFLVPSDQATAGALAGLAAIYKAANPSFGQVRNTFPGEEAYFASNPNVAGMATEDASVILNPHRKFTSGELDSVVRNERVRLLLRSGAVPPPQFSITGQQQATFQGYGNQNDVLATISARLAAGDTSALSPTTQQTKYVNTFVEPALKAFGW